jgi:hypothetical protein
VGNIIGGAVAFALALAGGWLTKSLLETKALSLSSVRTHVPDSLWQALQPTGIDGSGRWIGYVERVLALISAWAGSYELLGGWFAFKVASKWETYANLLRLPDLVPGVDELAYLRARRAWGSCIMMRFLIGSATNAILGICAAGLGKWIGPLVAATWPRCGLNA